MITKTMAPTFQRLIITLQAVLFCLTAQAQERTITLKGSVDDAFLEVPLRGVQVSILSKDSTLLADSAQFTYLFGANDRLVAALWQARVKTADTLLLARARLKGYGDVWQPITLGADTLVKVPTLKMRRVREVKLGEVVVTATKVKMYYKGDTLVYNADAFNLPQGSMLDDLIRQMPGVTMNQQGEIFVNGRKIDELLLGSRSFMHGNKKVLMENLPYYTVKNIKVYDKQSDKSVALGYDADPKKYVMDVNLKEEYNRGYIANAEGAGGLPLLGKGWGETWLGRAFALGFTDRLRLTLTANANNVNESRHIGESGQWTPATMPQSRLITRSVATDIDYRARGNKLKNYFWAVYTSTTDRSDMRKRQETFLEGSTPTSLTESYNRTGNRQLRIANGFTLMKPMWLPVDVGMEYTTRNGLQHSAFEQWSDSLTASLLSRGLNEGTKWSVYGQVQGAVNIGKRKRHVSFYATMHHDDDDGRQADSYLTRQFVNPSEWLSVNSRDVSHRTTWGGAHVTYNMPLGKNDTDVNLLFTEGVNFTNDKRHDYLYHPDTLLLPSQIDALVALTDPNNSYDSHLRTFQNEVSISLYQYGTYKYSPNSPVNIGYERWRLGLSLPVRHERLSYQRGRLDTLARQTPVFLNVNAAYRYRSKGGKHDVQWSGSHTRGSADLMNRITFRDDSQPLVVSLGNPGLKGNVATDMSLSYSNNDDHGHQQQLRAEATMHYQHRGVAQAANYNAATGVYTYQPRNVNGAYNVLGKVNFSRAIDKNKCWTWQTQADGGLNHSVDFVSEEIKVKSEEIKVNTLMLHDEAWLQYGRKQLNVRLSGDFRWRHVDGKMRDFDALNITDFHYGLSARYTIPHLNTTLSADGTMYSRRGYGSSELNTDDFVLNASISQPFLKGKLIARIDAFDLLHQLSSIRYEVNAQGRTETWYHSLPHYIMLHLAYHWNKNPKKK